MSKNKESRRNFLKTAAFGALGTSALIAGLGTSEKALARFLSRKANAHVGEFLEKAAAGKTSDEISSAFLDTFDSVMKLAAEKPEVQAGIDKIGEYFSKDVRTPTDETVPPIGLNKAVNDALTCAFLAASKAFEFGPVAADVVGKRLSRPEEILAGIEEGFLDQLIPAITERTQADREFGALLGKGNEQTQKIYETLDRDYPEELRVICRIGNRRVPCWLWGAVAVVVVVVFIFSK